MYLYSKKRIPIILKVFDKKVYRRFFLNFIIQNIYKREENQDLHIDIEKQINKWDSKQIEKKWDKKESLEKTLFKLGFFEDKNFFSEEKQINETEFIISNGILNYNEILFLKDKDNEILYKDLKIDLILEHINFVDKISFYWLKKELIRKCQMIMKSLKYENTNY